MAATEGSSGEQRAVVEVQHTLHSPGLHAPHNGLGVAAEEVALFPGGQRHSECTQYTRETLPDPSSPQVLGERVIKTAKKGKRTELGQPGGQCAWICSAKKVAESEKEQRSLALAGKELNSEWTAEFLQERCIYMQMRA